MRFSMLVGMPLLISGIASSQTVPNVGDILTKVSETYNAARQYELVLTMKEPERDTAIQGHAHVAFRSPNQYRLEGTFPDIVGDQTEVDEAIIVHDGTALWFYLPKSNEYGSIPASEVASDPEGSAHTPEATDKIAMQKYRDAANFTAGAKLLKEEELQIGTAKVACFVVSVPERWPGPYTWWIDKTNYHVLREDSTRGTTIYTSIKLSEQLPNSLFKFEPPPGARKLELDAR